MGHDVASHPHVPLVLLQSWPVPQATHAAPPVPHDPFDSDAYGSHVPFAVQHPFGQDVASQTHAPVVVLHSWPVAHALQAEPPAPHDPLDSPESGSQVLPLQQPVHERPPQVQTPSPHASPDAHAEQAAPPVPHADPVCAAKGRQMLPWQQPLGHDVESQTHPPVTLLHS